MVHHAGSFATVWLPVLCNSASSQVWALCGVPCKYARVCTGSIISSGCEPHSQHSCESTLAPPMKAFPPPAPDPLRLPGMLLQFQVDVILPKGTELTPELLQRIAAYNSTLSRALRQRSMKRREVMLQSAKVLGVVDADDADKSTLNLNIPRALAANVGASQQTLNHDGAEGPEGAAAGDGSAAGAEDGGPAGGGAASAAPAPVEHQLQLLMPGPNIRRRLRGFRSLAVGSKAKPAAGAAEAGAAAGGAASAGPGASQAGRKGRRRKLPPGPCTCFAHSQHLCMMYRMCLWPAGCTFKWHMILSRLNYHQMLLANTMIMGVHADIDHWRLRPAGAADDSSAHFPAAERRAPMTSIGSEVVASLGLKDRPQDNKGAATVSHATLYCAVPCWAHLSQLCWLFGHT